MIKFSYFAFGCLLYELTRILQVQQLQLASCLLFGIGYAIRTSSVVGRVVATAREDWPGLVWNSFPWARSAVVNGTIALQDSKPRLVPDQFRHQLSVSSVITFLGIWLDLLPGCLSAR